MTFNNKQNIAIARINSFVGQNTDKTFYLMGYAGTGKTFLIGKVIKKLLRDNIMDKIYVCAPTHQALNIIESYFKINLSEEEQIQFAPKLLFMTIHKLLHFKPVIMPNDGSKLFKSAKESVFLKQLNNKLIIIDECSMISRDMVQQLQKYTAFYPIKLIYMGDNMQLPPVGEPESQIFTNIPTNYHYHIVLDEIMRTNSAKIKDACTIIRTWDKKYNLCKLLLPVHANNESKSKLSSFKMYHKRSDYLNSTWFKNFVKKIDQGIVPIMLTWKNVTAAKYNSMIRKYIHKTANINTYLVGDYAMFNNYYMSPIDNTCFYTSNMIKINDISTKEKPLFDWAKALIDKPTNQAEILFNSMIKKLAKQKNTFKQDTFMVEKINVDNHQNAPGESTIKTINMEDLIRYHSMLEDIKQQITHFYAKTKSESLTSKLWNIYHKKLIDPYAEITFGYSITVYKAQGSTFHTVFIDIEDMMDNKNNDELQKALYTAAGRASNELGLILA